MSPMDNTIEFDFLNAPIVEERPWAVFAACRDIDPEIFFPNGREQESRALAICATCPVAEDCLEYAVDSRERYGVWGGTTEKSRRRLLHRMS